MEMRYYDLKRNWTRRITPYLADKDLNEILTRDFNLYRMGRWARPFTHGMLPAQIENCDWRCGHQGRYPRFWSYVKQGACHWIVNFALRLACLAEPAKDWRIVTSDSHSTVWDGEQTLFEFNYQAFGVPPGVCWTDASTKGQVLKPGHQEPCTLTSPYFEDYREPELALDGAKNYLQRLISNKDNLPSPDFLGLCLTVRRVIAELAAIVRKLNRPGIVANRRAEQTSLFERLEEAA
jgi:hypothetical protein